MIEAAGIEAGGGALIESHAASDKSSPSSHETGATSRCFDAPMLRALIDPPSQTVADVIARWGTAAAFGERERASERSAARRPVAQVGVVGKSARCM